MYVVTKENSVKKVNDCCCWVAYEKGTTAEHFISLKFLFILCVLPKNEQKEGVIKKYFIFSLISLSLCVFCNFFFTNVALHT